MKKILSCLILISVTSYLFSPSIAIAQTKQKIPKNIEFAEAFNYLLENDILDQKAYKIIALDSQMPKREFVTILLKSLGFSPQTLSEIKVKRCFDLPKDSPYIPYFEAAINLNIIRPLKTKKNCRPLSPVSKKQALFMIFQGAGIPAPKIFAYEYKPKDLKISDLSSPLFSKALEINLINVDKSNFIQPNHSLSYREGIELIYKMMLYLDPEIRKEINIPEIKLEIDFNKLNELFNQQLDNTITIINEKDIPNLEVLLTILEKLSTDYYFREKDKMTKEIIVYNAIKAILEKLSDPHTQFQEPASNLIQQALGQKFEGVGIQIQEKDQEIIISNIIKNTPAFFSGLKAKDILKKINGESVLGLKLDEIANRIRGPTGSEVSLTIFRPESKQELIFVIKRAEIQINQIDYRMLENEIGLIEINVFNQNADQDFKNALFSLNAQNMKKLIVDVRGNPGGFFDVTLNILENFLEKDKIITHLLFLDKKVAQKSNGDGNLKNIPLIVLIDEGSASASEIFAAAIKEHGIGKIVGTKSFGKGTVQEVIFFKDNSVFKLTIAEWLTPKENKIDGIGIIPDVVVENSPNEDSQLKKALELLNQ